jgi:hypothetical protein
MTAREKVIEEAIGVVGHAIREWITDVFARRAATREENAQRQTAVKEMPR